MKERCDREWPQRSFWCSLGEIRRWKYTPKQLNNQQRGQHRRLGKAHGAREDPEAASFRRARKTHRGQPWQAASCRPICLDTQCPACTQDRLPWLGLKAVETPSTSCESCQALSALFPIAGARAANTAETVSKERRVYVRKQKILLHEAQGKFLHQ